MKLARVYIRVRFPTVPEQTFNGLAQDIEQRFVVVGRELFGPGYSVQVELEAGTLSLRVKLWGMIPAIYATVAMYPDFEAGFFALRDRGKQFIEYVEEEFKDITNFEEKDVISKRQNLDDIDLVLRIMQNLERVKHNEFEVERRVLVEEIQQDLLRLYRSSSKGHEYKKILELLPVGNVPELPVEPEQLAVLERRRREAFSLPRKITPPDGARKPPRLRYRHTTRL